MGLVTFEKQIYGWNYTSELNAINETISRIKSHKSVEGLLITDKDKRIIRTNYTGDRAHEGDLLRSTVPL